MLKRLGALMVVAALTLPSATAQDPPEKHAAKMRIKLEKIFDTGDRAKIELKDGRRVQGHIAELAADSFVLADDGRSNTYSYSEVKKVGRFGPSQSTKRWVGLGVLGGLLGLTFWAAATQTR